MRITIILIILLTSEMALAQAYFTRNVDSLIYQYISDHNIPSVAIGVVYGDSIMYEKRITKDSLKGEPITSDQYSVYNIASVSKTLTALAIMMLVEEDKVRLQDPVVKHLPYFKINSKYSSEITIAQLLTHTSGLPSVSHPDIYKYLNPDFSDNALENHIRSLINLELQFKPGKKYAYSNVGYEILGDVLAKASQLLFEEFMQLRIFQPMNMTHTSFVISDFPENIIAPPYSGHPFRKTEKFPYDHRFFPSGNLFTSVHDLNAWLIFNLNNGSYKDFHPLSDENYAMFLTPRVDTKDGFKSHGWFVKDSNAGKILFHDGLDLGYSALIVLLNQHRIGIVVLSNHQQTDCNEILNIVAKSVRY